MILHELPDAVVERLATMGEEARAAHPELAFSPDHFTAYAMARVPVGVDAVAHLEGMRAADLFLTAACARGENAAILAFERRCFDVIPLAHARVRPPATVDEVKQMIRHHLFVPGPDGLAKITQYGATGDLRAWFRVVLVRHLLNFATRAPRETALDDAMLDMLPAAATDPELEQARRLYGPLLKAALVESIAALERRERTLLRLAVCDGLTVDALGELFGVHRATAARWVAAARKNLEDGVRERLRAKLGAGDDSLASLCRLLASQVEVSLRRHLVTSPGVAPSTGHSG